MRLLSLLVGVFALSVFNPSYAESEIVKGSKTIVHTGGQTFFDNIVLTAKLYDVITVPVRKEVTWRELECDYEPGNGKGDWKGYYNVPKAEKPAALAAAIRGIGKSTAEKIVYAKSGPYFQPKPRTWNAFKSEISKIERELRLDGLWHEVVATYGSDNSKNLGYQGGESCRWVTKRGTKVVWVKQKQFRKNLSRVVAVEIQNALLLKGEQEKIVLEYDGDVLSVRYAGVYNNYSASIDERANLITVVASGRRAVSPSYLDFTYSLEKADGTLYLVVKDGRYDEIVDLSNDYTINVTFQLVRDSGSGCKRDTKALPSSASLAEGGGRINLGSAVTKKGETVLQAGAAFFVEGLRFERAGVPFFKGQSTAVKTTPVQF